MTRESHERSAELFRLLALEPRLQILDELRRGEACVCHLQATVGRPQAYVSQQLRVLREAGVIECRKEGAFVFYRLADTRMEAVLAEVLGPADQLTPLVDCDCPRCGGAGCSA